MNRIIFPLLAGTVLLLAGCKKDNGSGSGTDPDQLITPRLVAAEHETPFTGALEVFPCKHGTTIYFGNYFNDRLSFFNALYTIFEGNVYSTPRPITLPIGEYNLIYWGVSQLQEPTYISGAIHSPGIGLNNDLSRENYSLREYPGADTTYYPVYDFVFAKQEVDIGAESISVSLQRVVAGLTVLLQKDDHTELDPEIASIDVLIGNIAEELDFATGEPQNQTKTVRFPITIDDNNMSAVNPIALVFPSAPNPPLTIVLKLKDGTIRTFRTVLNNELKANTKLTVTVNMGEILDSETTAGGFEVNKWEEKSETVNAEPVP